MKVTVRLFAMLRERAGAREVELELPDGARISDALTALREIAPPELPLVMAVNREYARDDRVLDPGDELALIPPVSGGSGLDGGTLVWARVTDEPLSLDRVTLRVSDPRAGAVVSFQGVTRDVDSLEYEAYVEMAEEKIAAIVAAPGRGVRGRARDHRPDQGRSADLEAGGRG